MKWHYLTVFIDLFSRIVVGWDLSESLERYSAMHAFNKAILRRRPSHGLMIHSDRGIQSASGDFRAIIKKRLNPDSTILLQDQLDWHRDYGYKEKGSEQHIKYEQLRDPSLL